jgi:hypothetical protein
MAQVLFCLVILMNIGTLLIPLTSPTRGHAVWGWLVNALAAGALSGLIAECYPSWEEPQWHRGNPWILAAWLLLIIGFIVAIRKPRKRNASVA